MARWYKHIASYEDEFPTLAGDATKPYTAYGPDEAELALNEAKASAAAAAPAAAAPAAAADDDDDDNLFSSDEEEDEEEARAREERLAEYRKKKEAKPKTIAKSIVTMDVKPWGT